MLLAPQSLQCYAMLLLDLHCFWCSCDLSKPDWSIHSQSCFSTRWRGATKGVARGSTRGGCEKKVNNSSGAGWRAWIRERCEECMYPKHTFSGLLLKRGAKKWMGQGSGRVRGVGNELTLKVLVTTINAQWEGMRDVGLARYEPALLPPCPTIRVLSCSN